MDLFKYTKKYFNNNKFIRSKQIMCNLTQINYPINKIQHLMSEHYYFPKVFDINKVKILGNFREKINNDQFPIIKLNIYCKIVNIEWNWDQKTFIQIMKFYQENFLDKFHNIKTDLNINYSKNKCLFSLKFTKYSSYNYLTFDEIRYFIYYILITSKPNIKYFDHLNYLNYLPESNDIIKKTVIYNYAEEHTICLIIDFINKLIEKKYDGNIQLNFLELGNFEKNINHIPNNLKFTINILNSQNDKEINYINKLHLDLITFSKH